MTRKLLITFIILLGSTFLVAQSSYQQFVNLPTDKDGYSYLDSVRQAMDSVKYLAFLKDLKQEANIEKDYRVIALSSLYLGNYYYNRSRLVEAVKNLNEGLMAAKETSKADLIAQTNMSLGAAYGSLYRKDDQLKHYLAAFDLYIKNDSIKAANVQYNIANVYYSIGSYNEAIAHGHKAFQLFQTAAFRELNPADQNNYMSLFNTMGISFNELNKYDSAIYYLDKSYKLATTLGSTFWQNLVNGNLGSVYLKKGNYEKAVDLMSKDLATSLNFKEMASAANAAIGLGDTYFAQQNFSQAKYYYDSAYSIIDEHKITESLTGYLKSIYQWYEANGEFEAALQSHKAFIKLRDSLNGVRNSVELTRIKSAYDFDKQLAEINLLTKNNELQENEIERRNIIIISSVAFILLIVVMSYYMYRSLKIKKRDNQLLLQQKTQIAQQSELLSEKNKTIQNINVNLEREVSKRTRKLKQVNKELDTFLYRASHDIRQPIATILGLEYLARQYAKDKDMETILEKLNSTANGMDLMLSKLQMLYRLNHGEIDNKKINIKLIVDDILRIYKDTIDRKDIAINNEIIPTTIYSNPDLLIIILRNLIENAVYFSHNDHASSIHLSSTLTDDMLVISITDNGYGIDADLQKQIFNAYFKGNEHSKGNGLGLYICQKAAQALGITIRLESEVDEGSTFYVEVPIKLVWREKNEPLTKGD